MPEESPRNPPPPHDAFALLQFSDVRKARPLLREFLPPALVERANWPSLKVLPGHFISEELRGHRSDLLFSLEVEDEPVLLYVLFEHKSWVDPQARFQLLRGMVGAWDEWLRNRPKGESRPLRLPLIIPFVLYHGQTSWTVSTGFADLVAIPRGLMEVLRAYVPGFEHALVDLHGIPMDQLRGTAELRLVLGLLKAVSEGREEDWIDQVFQPGMDLLTEPDDLSFLRSLLTYLARASGRMTSSTFTQIIARVPNQKQKSEVMTLAEQWIEEGRQKGVHEGVKEGVKEGRRGAIVEVIEARWGNPPPAVRARIDQITSESELSRALRLASRAESVSDFLDRLERGE